MRDYSENSIGDWMGLSGKIEQMGGFVAGNRVIQENIRFRFSSYCTRKVLDEIFVATGSICLT